jgi:hypothetical protein
MTSSIFVVGFGKSEVTQVPHAPFHPELSLITVLSVHAGGSGVNPASATAESYLATEEGDWRVVVKVSTGESTPQQVSLEWMYKVCFVFCTSNTSSSNRQLRTPEVRKRTQQNLRDF